jgi:hypothetical protein
VPAESVTTFLIDGVHGVAKDAAHIQEGHLYSLQGVESGKSLAPSPDGTSTVIRSGAAADQHWNLRLLSGENTNRARYAIETADGDSQLAAADGSATLVPAAPAPALEAQWIASTTGDGTYTLVNAATGRLLEVGGHATAEGAAATLWTANSGTNQLWKIIDQTVQGFQDVTAFTVPGVMPVLPADVTPLYQDGARGKLAVTWKLPPDSAWKKAGRITVKGTATDVLGRVHDVSAVVTVDTLVSTLPARAKAYPGGTAELPATVTAVGAKGGTVERPVTWDTAGPFTEFGVVSVNGTADAGDGHTLPATLRIQVVQPGVANAADDDGASISATFTEPGYGTAGLRNGNLTDKAWSNWKSGTKNAADTLTATLAAERTVSEVKVHFHRDGSTDSYAQSLQVQTRTADGTWQNAGGPVAVPGGNPAPVVSVPVGTVNTKEIRIIMTARPNTHMVVSEVEIMALTPGTSSEAAAASITIDGQALAGFGADVMSYEVPSRGKTAVVSATTADPYATVTIQQATKASRTAVITVTSEDGTQTRAYQVTLGG